MESKDQRKFLNLTFQKKDESNIFININYNLIDMFTRIILFRILDKTNSIRYNTKIFENIKDEIKTMIFGIDKENDDEE